MRLFCLQAAIGAAERRGQYETAWRRLTSLPDLRVDHFRRGDDGFDLDYLYSYAALLRGRGDWKAAKEMYEMAGKTGSDPAQAWLALVILYLERRDEDPLMAEEWYLMAADGFADLRAYLTARLEQKPPAAEHDDRDAQWQRAKDLLALGPLLVEMKHHDEAYGHLAEAIEILTDLGLRGEPVAIGHAYVGLARAGNHDYQSATVALTEALKYDPDNIDYKQRLADLLQQVELFDQAEELYREVLAAAPKNVDALIGLGEVLLGLGTAQFANPDARGHIADPELFKDAGDAFTDALVVAKETATKGVQFRTGSRSLNVREQAAIHYNVGYAAVMGYQASAKGRVIPRFRPPLAQARSAFKRAKECDPQHSKAARALRQLSAEKQSKPSRWGGYLLMVISLLLLTAAQGAFYVADGLGLPTTLQRNPTIYATLTFGLLGFLLAAVTLPELLKFGVGGVQIEKSRTEQVDPLAGISITRDQAFTARFARRLGSVWPIRPETGTVPTALHGDDEVDERAAGAQQLRERPGHQRVARPAGDARKAPKEFQSSSQP